MHTHMALIYMVPKLGAGSASASEGLAPTTCRVVLSIPGADQKGGRSKATSLGSSNKVQGTGTCTWHTR